MAPRTIDRRLVSLESALHVRRETGPDHLLIVERMEDSQYYVQIGREHGQVITSEDFARIRESYVRVLEIIIELPKLDNLVGTED